MAPEFEMPFPFVRVDLESEWRRPVAQRMVEYWLHDSHWGANAFFKSQQKLTHIRYTLENLSDSWETYPSIHSHPIVTTLHERRHELVLRLATWHIGMAQALLPLSPRASAETLDAVWTIAKEHGVRKIWREHRRGLVGIVGAYKLLTSADFPVEFPTPLLDVDYGADLVHYGSSKWTFIQVKTKEAAASIRLYTDSELSQFSEDCLHRARSVLQSDLSRLIDRHTRQESDRLIEKLTLSDLSYLVDETDISYQPGDGVLMLKRLIDLHEVGTRGIRIDLQNIRSFRRLVDRARSAGARAVWLVLPEHIVNRYASIPTNQSAHIAVQKIRTLDEG